MHTILIVEDETRLLEDIRDLLSFEGYVTLTAFNGREGVALAREHLPDLIVSDVMMPVLDGYGMLRALRDDPRTARIPLIFLTARAEREDIRHGMDLGADDYIVKPFTFEELLNAVQARLSRQDVLVRDVEEAVDHLRGNILYMLPHELRTPLTGILGYAELLRSHTGPMDEALTHEIGDTLFGTASRLRNLIEDFLVYAQTEIIAFDPARLEDLRRLTITDPRAEIAAHAQRRAAAAERGADLRLSLNDTTRVQVTGENLRKIVEGLLEHAFRTSAPGTPVDVETDVNRGAYTLLVRDRGLGLSADQIARLSANQDFEAYFGEGEGAFLGLVLARRIAELHGGRLHISSQPGGETTVRVVLRCRA
jgi:two-component system sensor histidine kinase/response regulator